MSEIMAITKYMKHWDLFLMEQKSKVCFAKLVLNLGQMTFEALSALLYHIMYGYVKEVAKHRFIKMAPIT